MTICPVLAAALLLLAITFHGVRTHRAQAAMLHADPERILSDAALRATALAVGRPVYLARCAACHGATAKGDRALGAPDLTDDDHLYGEGLVAQIEEIARHGIRSHDTRGWNLAVMPAFASAVPDGREKMPPQSPEQIEALTQFLLSLTGNATDQAMARRGMVAFQHGAGCWDCHSADAGGDSAIGAPTLSDVAWLYGDGGHDDIYRSIAGGRAGISPAFNAVLSAAELRAVAVYTASLAPPHPALRSQP